MDNIEHNTDAIRPHSLINSIELSELLPEPIIEIDISGRIIYMNKRGREKFEINDIELNHGIDVFSLVNFDDKEKCRSCFDDIKNNPQIHKLICTLINKSGDTFHVVFNLTPIYDENKKIIEFVGFIQDITDLTKVEEELKSLNKDLENRIREKTIQMEFAMTELKTEVSIRKRMSQKLQSAKEEISKAFQKELDLSEMKSRFISMITHEFRTPLTIIISSANMLERFYKNGNEGKFFKHLEKIKISSKNLSNLIERTITIGQSEAGVVKVKPEMFDIIDFFKEMMKEIEIFDKKKHRVSFHSEIDILNVVTDRSLLTTIFNNIISNALKYTDENKSIKIEVINEIEFVQIELSDEGIGIPEDEIKELFKPFQRCSNVGTRQGSGLGLSIVNKFLEFINGDIQINSHINIGTKVIIRIAKKLV